MPGTYTSLHYHVTFSTKERFPFIKQKWMRRLHAYIGGTVRTAGGEAIRVGGVSDHVHLVLRLKPTHCLSDVLRDIKRESSTWVHQDIGQTKFAWQEGYGAFTISSSNLDTVIDYVARQAEHHRKRSFQEEFRELLVRHGIEFREEHLW